MQVILLSRLSRRLDAVVAKMQKMEERVEAIYARTEEVMAMIGHLTKGGKSYALAHDPKPSRPFADYIKSRERAPEILAQLHEWIDNNRKSKALVYLKAATEARVLEQPPYPAAAAEFPGRLGSESLYYAYLGEPDSFTEKAQEKIVEAVKVLNKIAHD